MPPDIPHGVPKGDKEGDYYRPYDEIEILCEPGYSYKGSSQFIMCEEEGQWEDEFGECSGKHFKFLQFSKKKIKITSILYYNL